MSSVAHSPPEQSQLASVRERGPLSEPTGLDPPNNLDASLDAARCGSASTVAYLIASLAVPDEAREVAIEKAGGQITVVAANEIVAGAKKRKARANPIPADKLALRLVRVPEHYRERRNPKELSELAGQLREFAHALEKPERDKKKARSQ
jgi:hypothetical protein